MEFLVLTKKWLSEPYGPKYDKFLKIINKGYSKNLFKYKIIKTHRIKTSMSILDNFKVLEHDDFCILILLGPEKQFEKLKNDRNYSRTFETPYDSWEGSIDCIIPDEYVPQLSFDTDSKVKMTYYNSDEQLTPSQVNRIIGTVGFKSYDGDLKSSDPAIKDLEVTALTSFMKRAAPTMLDLAIKHLLKRENELITDLSGLSSIVLQVDCIKEHNLVPYYVNCCSFIPAEKEDTFIDVHSAGSSGIFEDNLEAYKDFHISYLYRIVDLP